MGRSAFIPLTLGADGLGAAFIPLTLGVPLVEGCLYPANSRGYWEQLMPLSR